MADRGDILSAHPKHGRDLQRGFKGLTRDRASLTPYIIDLKRGATPIEKRLKRRSRYKRGMGIAVIVKDLEIISPPHKFRMLYELRSGGMIE
jgi:hypothetical protein